MTSDCKCYGSVEEVEGADLPICEGPDIRKVEAVSPDGEEVFETMWCAECRAIAKADGYIVEVK